MAQLPAGGDGPPSRCGRSALEFLRRPRRGPPLPRRAPYAVSLFSGGARPPALRRRRVRLRDFRGLVPLFGRLRGDSGRGHPLSQARRGSDPDGFALVQPRGARTEDGRGAPQPVLAALRGARRLAWELGIPDQRAAGGFEGTVQPQVEVRAAVVRPALDGAAAGGE